MRNAVIHTPAGTPSRSPSAAKAAWPCSRCAITGPACPTTPTDQLFERFWRTEGGRSRGKGGAGLGLAIVKAIAVAHGGSVSAGNVDGRDEDGGGAVFQRGRCRALPAAAPSQENLSLLTSDSYLDHAD